ncbi:hypothetical protein [Mycobacterium colombiense]|uniref:Cytochrome C biogenesis protein transmembrane domain-containing protein n=1 Tax=Mycobacterium colombiense TaxID=339268 RepID=A0A1A2YXD2_9MYCO|nr:hypothetical protein [Mycobacterium colombiense]OBI42068.1 hypothetical protein A5708_21830 [Mycobacterium colombiense]
MWPPCSLAAPVLTNSGQVGYVSLAAVATLVAGSLPTIALAKPLLARWPIPDRVHAIAYLILLGMVMVTMVATITG